LNSCQQSWHAVPVPIGSTMVSPQFWQTSNRPMNWKSERYLTSRSVSSRQVGQKIRESKLCMVPGGCLGSRNVREEENLFQERPRASSSPLGQLPFTPPGQLLEESLPSGTIADEYGTTSGFLLHSLVPFTVTRPVTSRECRKQLSLVAQVPCLESVHLRTSENVSKFENIEH
jgi:hypothetical protein